MGAASGNNPTVTTDRSLDTTRVLAALASVTARRQARAALVPLGASLIEAPPPADLGMALRMAQPDVLLIDRATDRAVVAHVKSDPDLFRVAVILVDGAASAEDVLDAFAVGVDEIVVGRLSAAELVARVHGARRAQRLRDELLGRQKALEDLAYHDELTGLPNRRFAMRQLSALLSRARRHGEDLTVAIVDADHFKALNDEHGHAYGDGVLRGLATCLDERLRDEDLVARIGGEEFLVVLPETDGHGALAIAEDLRRSVAAAPMLVGARRLDVTVSVGWALWSGESPEELLERADRALYDAKEAGRDRVRGAPAPLAPAS